MTYWFVKPNLLATRTSWSLVSTVLLFTDHRFVALMNRCHTAKVNDRPINNCLMKKLIADKMQQ